MTELNNNLTLIPAGAFSYEELTDVYNCTRVDYIVPMPMNAARLQKYVTNYNISLDASVVAVDGNEILGLSMLGLREKRAWISRLGVIRTNRRQRTGWTMVNHLVEQAQQHKAEYIIIEVINDNYPAQQMFFKKGFEITRQLLVLRRPPGPVKLELPPATIEEFGEEKATELLEMRRAKPSWIDEKESLVNAGSLAAYQANLEDGSRGWLVYQNTAFQLGRLVIQTESGDPAAVGKVLLAHLHKKHPLQDTKTENLPIDDPHWPAFQALGYLEIFRRNEMILSFTAEP